MNTILEAKNITKIYNRHTKNEFEALRGISLEVHEGDFICIMGPSGSGKSTLINNLSTIDMPTKGSGEHRECEKERICRLSPQIRIRKTK